MQYLLDTVTIVRHFSGRRRIGRTAAHILDTIEERDDLLVISVISLMEIMYLAERNRITINLTEFGSNPGLICYPIQRISRCCMDF